jgi:hypothetical protein
MWSKRVFIDECTIEYNPSPARKKVSVPAGEEQAQKNLKPSFKSGQNKYCSLHLYQQRHTIRAFVGEKTDRHGAKLITGCKLYWMELVATLNGNFLILISLHFI